MSVRGVVAFDYQPQYIDHVYNYTIKDVPENRVRVKLMPNRSTSPSSQNPKMQKFRPDERGTWQKGKMPVTIKSVDNLKGIDIRVEADGFNPQQRNVKRSPPCSRSISAQAHRKRDDRPLSVIGGAVHRPETDEDRKRNQPGEEAERLWITAAIRKEESWQDCRVFVGETSRWPMLSINSRPAARIYIDGADLGDTPKLNHQVSEGQHSVLLQIPSGDTVKADSFDVYVGSGEKVICIYGG